MNAYIITHAKMMAHVSTLKKDSDAFVPTGIRDAHALVIKIFLFIKARIFSLGIDFLKIQLIEQVNVAYIKTIKKLHDEVRISWRYCKGTYVKLE